MMLSKHLLQVSNVEVLETVEENARPSHPLFGLLLSVISALLVGGSFILQKKGLIKATAKLSSKG